MSTVSDRMPSRSITSWACSRLSGLDVRYGSRTPITRSLPSASAARNAVSEESTPPDNPTIPFSNPRRTTTSSRRKLTSQRRANSQSIARGSPSSTPRPTTCKGETGDGTPETWDPLAAGSNCTAGRFRFPLPEVSDEVRQIHLEVGQERRIRPRPRQLLQIDVGGQHRLLEQRPAQHDLSPGIDQQRAAREPFTALEPHQARVRDVHPVFLRDALEDPLPPHHARGQACASFVHAGAAGRGRTRHEDELRAVQSGDRARERVPRVLADEDGRPAPPRVEGR